MTKNDVFFIDIFKFSISVKRSPDVIPNLRIRLKNASLRYKFFICIILNKDLIKLYTSFSEKFEYIFWFRLVEFCREFLSYQYQTLPIFVQNIVYKYHMLCML